MQDDVPGVDVQDPQAAQVKPRETFYLGAPKRIPFIVQVDEPTAGSYQVPATLEQRAIIPNWVKPLAGLAVVAIVAILVLPSLLGLNGNPDGSPIAVASTPPPASEPPTSLGPNTPPPEATAGPSPSPAINAPPSRFVVTEDLNPTSGLLLECARGEPCRDQARALLTQILTNLQTKADGTKLLDFDSMPDGSLPLLVEWDDAIYQYTSAVGESGETDRVRVDLAPFISGIPGYVLIEDTLTNQIRKYTLPPGDGGALYELLYEYTPAPDPTLLPLPSGVFDYGILVPIERQWVFSFDWTQ